MSCQLLVCDPDERTDCTHHTFMIFEGSAQLSPNEAFSRFSMQNCRRASTSSAVL